MLTYERALQRELVGPQAQELIARLEQGELTVDSVIARLGSAALTDQQRQADDAPG